MKSTKCFSPVWGAAVIVVGFFPLRIFLLARPIGSIPAFLFRGLFGGLAAVYIKDQKCVRRQNDYVLHTSGGCVAVDFGGFGPFLLAFSHSIRNWSTHMSSS